MLSRRHSGHKCSEETKAKISRTLQGHLVSLETRQKLKDKFKGRSLSEETKRKMSLSRQGTKHWLYGKHHTIATIEKIRKTKTGVPLSEENKLNISKANKGRRKTEQEKEAIRLRQLGNKNGLGHECSQETREKMRESSRRGEKSEFWKGGVTPIHRKIRMSVEYRLWREAIFKRDDYTCQNCFQRGGRLNADHIKPFSLFPELRLALDNGRTLCESCHSKIGWKGSHVDQQISIIQIN